MGEKRVLKKENESKKKIKKEKRNLRALLSD